VPRNSEPGLKNHVRELRMKCEGMTQQALADRVGVTRQTILALEGSAYTPSLALALRIAKTFEKSIEEIFWLEEKG